MYWFLHLVKVQPDTCTQLYSIHRCHQYLTASCWQKLTLLHLSLQLFQWSIPRGVGSRRRSSASCEPSGSSQTSSGRRTDNCSHGNDELGSGNGHEVSPTGICTCICTWFKPHFFQVPIYNVYICTCRLELALAWPGHYCIHIILGWCKASRGRAFAHNMHVDSTGEGLNCPLSDYLCSQLTCTCRYLYTLVLGAERNSVAMQCHDHIHVYLLFNEWSQLHDSICNPHYTWVIYPYFNSKPWTYSVSSLSGPAWEPGCEAIIVSYVICRRSCLNYVFP